MSNECSAPTPEQPQRYDLVTNYRCGESVEELEKAEDGEWVRWSDVSAGLRGPQDVLVADLRTRLAKVEKHNGELTAQVAQFQKEKEQE